MNFRKNTKNEANLNSNKIFDLMKRECVAKLKVLETSSPC
jgi:hypothetical protein